MKYENNTVSCGGTFDRLHLGHKTFLDFVFSKGRFVYIGLTSDEYIEKNKAKENIQSFGKRKKDLEIYLEEKEYLNRAKIISIDNIYGPLSNSNISIDALVVTENTIKNAAIINQFRIRSGYLPVKIITMSILKVANIPISSSKVRKGLMTIDGDLLLPSSLREELKKPYGNVITNDLIINKFKNKNTVAIGDVTTKKLNKLGVDQAFSVIDFVINRQKTYENLKELGFNESEIVLYADNPSGQITRSLWLAVSNAILNIERHKRIVIIVNGEEDLSVVPFVLLLPSGWNILYGQPNYGIVHIKINKQIKEKFINILSTFERISTRGY